MNELVKFTHWWMQKFNCQSLYIVLIALTSLYQYMHQFEPICFYPFLLAEPEEKTSQII